MTLPEFRRSYAVNFHRNLRLPMGEMSFEKNWIGSTRGDPYPLISSEGDIKEETGNGVYKVTSENGGKLNRFAYGYFPYAAYSLKFSGTDGEVGYYFNVRTGDAPNVKIAVKSEKSKKALIYTCGDESKEFELSETDYPCDKDFELTVIAKAGSFDIYGTTEYTLKLIAEIDCPQFMKVIYEKVFRKTNAEICFEMAENSEIVVKEAKMFMDSGICQADVRPIRYEDGSPIMTDGKIYFTISSRQESKTHQSVISLVPGTEKFELEGAIFYDCGDGQWNDDVAASVIYDRNADIWRVWYCSFSHGHILAYGETHADLRHGINIIESDLMEKEKLDGRGRADLSDDRLFLAKYGDEDPDFIYDKKRNLWMMTICRAVETGNGKREYRYFRFESALPSKDFVYKENTLVGQNTGGSIVKLDDGYIFVCGSDFNDRAVYYKFEIGGFDKPERLKFDYDDGGFRGWGTVIRMPSSKKPRYMLITFDRFNGSGYNWSYGIFYVFTAVDE